MKARIFNRRFWINETNSDLVFRKFEKALLNSGFKILQKMEHCFDPYGYTALFLLAESHLAIHTFPEEEKSYVEISSCNEHYFNDFNTIIDNDLDFTIWDA